MSRRLIDVVVLASLSLGTLAASARVALAPRDPAGGVAVVFAPWTAEGAAFVRTVAAGARFVRFGGWPFITIAMPEHGNYADRVLAAGAWFVLDPKALAACLAPFRARDGRA